MITLACIPLALLALFLEWAHRAPEIDDDQDRAR